MNFFRREERGQTVVEFGIICSILLVLTVGLVDVGRAFYQYNALAAAARYGARWGAVVGGTCERPDGSVLSKNDWCIQPTTSSDFWGQPGNLPLQPTSSACTNESTGRTGCCPNTYTPADYYTANDPTLSQSGTARNIVQAIAQRFDTNSSSGNAVDGALTSGFDLSKMKICIQLPYNPTTGSWDTAAGSVVEVHVYYPFYPVSSLVTSGQIVLSATSQYVIE